MTGAATGAGGGGILGGLAGWLVGIGALAIPGVGPFIAAGAFGAALSGAAIGAGVGAVAGALVGMGIPKEEAEFYEGEVKSGRTLATVKADGRYSEARDVLKRHGAYDIESAHPGTATGATAGTYSGRWGDDMPKFRDRWQQRYGTTGTSRWEDEEPYHRYAYDMYNRPEYQNRSWNEVEPEFRRDWGRSFASLARFRSPQRPPRSWILVPEPAR